VLEPLKRNRFLGGIVIATAIGAVLCLAFYFDLLHSMQLRTGDFLFRAPNLDQRTGLEEMIVIVGIDDKSLDQLGRFSSWSRSYHAQLIDRLAEARARVVVFDILFSEPASGDEELATSIKNAGNVILPIVDRSIVNNPAETEETDQPESFLRAMAIFEEGAIAFGHANVVPDADGVVRRLPVTVRNGDKREPALALAAVAKYLRRPEAIESPIENNTLLLAGRLIPVSSDNEMLINYMSSLQENEGMVNVQTVSFIDVLNAEIDPNVFADKLVVIGATATGLGDTFGTPMGHMMNGVEIHANAIHTILSANFLKPAPSIATSASILILAVVCGLLVSRLRVSWAVLSGVSLCLVYFLIAFSLFDQGIVPNMLYPPLAILGTFMSVNLYTIIAERSEKREITQTFGRYISPSVVGKILAALEEGKLKLGGEEHEVTVAFADVRDFTSISEDIPPEELVRVLNIYLSAVIKPVLNYDGMINKFGGDGIMAVWNVPTTRERHALLATMAAMEAQRAISELQKIETALPKMDFGIGINTGKAVAGNMGSEDRLEYSVIGDAVNVAARLTNVMPGGKVWIGAGTFEQVQDYIVVKPLKPLVVKGKQKPLIVYEVVDIRSDFADEQNENAVTA